MKKLLFLLTGLFLVAIVGVLIFLQLFLAPEIKKIIEEKGSQALGSPVKVETVQVGLLPPFTVIVQHVKATLKEPAAVVDLENIKADISAFDLLSRKITASVLIDKPNIKIVLPDANDTDKKSSATDQVKTEAEVKAPGSTSFAMNIDVRVQSGNVLVSQALKNTLALRDIRATIHFTDLSQPVNVKIDEDTEINWAGIKMSFPASLQSAISYHDDILRLDGTQLTLSGLESGLTGFYNTRSQEGDFNITLDIKDFKSLKSLPESIAKIGLAGSLQAKVRLFRDLASTSWSAEGSVLANKVTGNSDFSNGENAVKGPFALDADLGFSYARTFSVSKLVADADLSGSDLKIGTSLKKPASVPFKLDINASQNKTVLVISQAHLTFADLKASASGSVDYTKGAPSDIHIEVARTNLSGFEKYIPMLEREPLQGFVELKASVNGDLQDPKSLSLNLNPIQLENVRGSFSWSSPDKSKTLSGPLSLNAKAVVVAQGSQLKSANVTAQADLSRLEIDMSDMLQKKAGIPLRLDVVAAQKGSSLEIKRGSLITSAGTMIIKGSVREPQAPLLKLDLNIPRLDLGQLSRLMPMLQKWNLSGTVSSEVSLGGSYDFAKGVEKSPLTLTGQVAANMPSLVMPSAKAADGKTGIGAGQASEKAEKPEPLLPVWPITQSMTLRTSLKLARFQRDDLVAKRIDWKGFIAGGVLHATATVGEVFGGGVNVTKLELPLLQAAPTTVMRLTVANLDLGQALAWSMPEFKDLLKGKATGNLSLKAAHPSRSDFIDATVASGDVKIINGFLSTLQFDNLVKEKLAKIPSVGSEVKSFSTKGAAANITSRFDYAKSQLNLQTLDVITPEKNELQGIGWVRADKKLDVKAKVFIKDPPVKGSFHEANSDSTGRLVVPVHFMGDVFNPSADIAAESLQEMATRTAQYEGNKLRKQAEERARSETQKVIEENKNRLKEEAQQKLKGLLGQ